MNKMRKRWLLFVFALCMVMLAKPANAMAASKKYVRSLTVAKKTVSIKKGKTQKVAYKVKVKGKASKKVTVKTSNKKVTAKVKSGKIVITAKKAGTSKITITTKGKSKKGTKLKKYIKVTVTEGSLQNPNMKKDSSMKAGQKVTWDCVWFGSYPQREVISKEMQSSYNAKNRIWYDEDTVILDDTMYQTLQDADDWDQNNEIVVDGSKYRRIQKSDAREVSNDTTPWYCWYSWNVTGGDSTWHYFKYEPIKWRVLSTNDKQALLLADVSLDVQKYYDADYEDLPLNNVTKNNWKASSLRAWLNQTTYREKSFVDTAFTSEEQAAIINTVSENKVTDKIRLISTEEIWGSTTAESYGFTKDNSVSDEARRSKTSTYAKAMGISISKETKGYSNWWICPANGSSVQYDGQRQPWGDMISITYLDGVRPVLKLDLSADTQYSYAGTVSSDGNVKEQKMEK